MTEYFDARWSTPVVSSPTQFDAINELYMGKHASGNEQMDTLRSLSVAYGDAHSGEAVDALTKAMRHVTSRLRTSLFGYDDVAAAAEVVAAGLRRLESNAADAGGLAGLVDALRKAEESEPTPGFGAPEPGDGAYSAYLDVTAEFKRIQDAEEALLNEFAEQLRGAARGLKADLDNAELERFLGRMLKSLPPASDTYERLVAAKALLVDEADGSLDTLDGQLAELAEQGMSPEDIEAIAAHPRAGEVAAFDAELAVAVARDEVDFPSDKDMDEVASAIVDGQTPADAGLPPLYFPPDYRETSAEIGGIRRERERLLEGGFPADASPADRSATLASLRKIEADLLAELDLTPHTDNDKGLDEVRATTVTGDYFGDDEWTGEALGKIFESEIYIRGDEPKSELSGEALSEIADSIDESGDASAAFFEEIGTEHAAALPTIVVEQTRGDGAAVETIDNFSEGLGEATRTGDLPEGFTGEKLIKQGDRNTAALFQAGDFEIDFEADAMVAVMEKAPVGSGTRRHPTEWPGFDWDGRDGLAEHFGTDQRDLIFEKGTENPLLGVEVSQRLIDNGNAHLLIAPVSMHPEQDYTDRPPPISGFLATVGTDPDVAGGLLAEASDDVELQPQVAAGVDAIMAQHATVIYDSVYLGEHGIDPDGSGRLSQERAEAVFGVGPDEWSRLSGLVNDQGFGGFLLEGN